MNVTAIMVTFLHRFQTAPAWWPYPDTPENNKKFVVYSGIGIDWEMRGNPVNFTNRKVIYIM